MSSADGDPHDVLWDLLDAGKKTEIVWRASQAFFDFADYSEMDEVDEEFRGIFDGLVDDLTSSMGEPRFRGGRDRTGFPTWSTALHLAIWAQGDAAAYVAVVHPTRDDPFELRLGVR